MLTAKNRDQLRNPPLGNMLVLYCFCVATEFLVNKDSYNRVWATFLHRKWHVVLKDASDFLL